MERFNKLAATVLNTVDDNRSVLPRLIIGLVFLSEGIQKFLFPELVGAGRFEKIGFSDPVFWAGFVAAFEITCGTFILLGFIVRMASIPLIIIMITAIITTKLPIIIQKGFWAMAHESRTDFAMLLLLLFLVIYGAGKWSVDHKIIKRIKRFNT